MKHSASRKLFWAVLIAVLSLSFSVQASAQKKNVTVKADKITVANLIKEVEKQTDYYQMLDDCEWTVRAAIAYDCIYDYISADERSIIEKQLLVPSAEFLMYGTAENRKNEFVFNRMHNHGTWALLAVGFVGLVTDNEDFVKKSLYGTDLTGKHGGLLKQIDELFSPDGYYYEGAYYQGYAMIPALAYAQCLNSIMPELNIFQRNDAALLKGARAMFNLSYNGRFFKMNDSCEESLKSNSTVFATDIIYSEDQSQKELLSIVEKCHKKVIVCEAGYKTAMDVARGLSKELVLKSSMIRDGEDGIKGATMVLRSSDGNDVLTMKACGQGGYHGHFDKLTIGYYSEGEEILSEYGFARYPGLSWKQNGRYTPLNRSYAMTTVAHNTLAVDSASHFNGITPHAIPHSPKVIAFSCEDTSFQYMGALDTSAVPGVRIERWCALAETGFLEKPVVIDILLAQSEDNHVYDLPFHYDGQVMNLSAPVNSYKELKPFGSNNGYQHLWLESSAEGTDGCVSFTFLKKNRFHTITTLTDRNTEIDLLRLGANDPEYILDRHPAFLLRKKCKSGIFVSCVESHGIYDSSLEMIGGVKASCKEIELKEMGKKGLRTIFHFEEGKSVSIIIDNGKMSIER